MTPCESFLLAKNGSLKLKQLALITFLMLEYRYKWLEMMHDTQCSNLTEARWLKYICNHEINVPSPLLPQWPCSDSYTWARCVQRANCFHYCIYIMPILLLWDLSTLWVMDHFWPLIYYAPCLACWALFVLFHWYQQCVTVRHVPKCMSCYKAIVVMTGRAHCFHDCKYIYIYI